MTYDDKLRILYKNVSKEILTMTNAIFRKENEYSVYQAMYVIMHGLDFVYSYSIEKKR